MFSLVNAPALGFELARRPGGARAAAVVRSALRADSADLAVFARAREHGDAAREAAWLALSLFERETSAADILRDVGEALSRDDAVGVTSSVRALERSPIGSLSQLMTMLRHDVLDWTWRRGADGVAVQEEGAAAAAAVLCDAAAASYLEHVLEPEHRRALCGPWLAADRQTGSVGDDLGARTTELEALFGHLRHLSEPQWETLVDLAETYGRRDDGPTWSHAAHEATWAVFLSGRLRPAAVAQLQLVELVAQQNVPVGTLARGAWNAVSGAVLATSAGDLMGDAAARRLSGPMNLVLAAR